MDNKHRVTISTFLSLVLRHRPGAAGIKLDAGGWARVADLLEGCKRNAFPITLEELEAVVETNDKKRFAFSPDRSMIRASQGHSLAVDLGYHPQTPPARLYHGTVERFIPSIREHGLTRGERHAVHLSPDQHTAAGVGRRRGAPVILTVQAGRMHAAGFTFRVSDNGVWLTDHVPLRYITFPGTDADMPSVRSCGVILFRNEPVREFLLMKHPRLYDLPKGHVEEGETETACALRELDEETGIAPTVVRLDPGFRYTHTYYPRYRCFGGVRVEKTVVIFLGWLPRRVTVRPGEHRSYEWVAWRPPPRIQETAIDPLLACVDRYFSEKRI